MSTETNLNVSPYYDDYDPEKNFHRVLFKPSLPVQARELTQMQTILQNQIERFGQNIFKTGTVISGCAVTTDPSYHFVKLNNEGADGFDINVSSFVNCIVSDSFGLTGIITNYEDGLESQAPDLKTIYLTYTKNGSNTEARTFQVGSTIVVQEKERPISDYIIVDGGTGYSNSWTAHVTPVEVGGTEAYGRLVTDASGVITDITAINTGKGYSNTTPGVYSVVIRDANNNVVVSGGAIITPVNYIARPIANAVGTGYGLKVAEGTIFQKGFFTRVDAQEIIVSKYESTDAGQPNNVAVGFSTVETIVNSSIDTTLLDNAAGYTNYQAPGADRLKLTPTLTLKTMDELVQTGNTVAVENFFSLVEFQNGNIVRDRLQTQFNSVDTELARRTYEESGDYVVEHIAVGTETGDAGTFANGSPNPLNDKVNVVIGKGIAYVQGRRNELVNDYRVPINQATNTVTINSLTIGTYYSHVFYTDAGHAAGLLDLAANEQLDLSNDLTGVSGSGINTIFNNNTVGTFPAAGSVIGTARVRGIELMPLSQGAVNVFDGSRTVFTVYRVALYDVQMLPGYSYKDIRSVGKTNKCAMLAYDISGRPWFDGRDTLVFPLEVGAVASLADTQTTYRRRWDNVTVQTNGYFSVTTGSANETLLNVGDTYSSSQKEDVVVIATAPISQVANLTGTVSISNTNYATQQLSVMTGVGTDFFTDFSGASFVEPRYIRIANSSGSNAYYTAVVSVTNTTTAFVTGNFQYGSSSTIKHFVPNNAIVPSYSFDLNSNSGGQTLEGTINFGSTWNSGGKVTVYASVRNAAPTLKTKTEGNTYIKIDSTVIAANPTGPWCIGVSDVFRLDGVWLGSGTSYANVAQNPVDVSDNFILYDGQSDAVYGLAYIGVRPGSAIDTTSTNLLVKVSYFSSTDGDYAAATSYPVGSEELIPIFVSPRTGESISLRDAVDFRLQTSNTITLTSNADLATTVNTSNYTTISTATVNVPVGGVKNPVPAGYFQADVSYYTGRKDVVVVNKDGIIRAIEGVSDVRPVKPTVPPGEMVLAELNIPPYPSLPAKDAIAANRLDHGIAIRAKQQTGFTMKDIQSIEDRIDRIEYYSSLSLLEANTAAVTIPSGANSALERFKYGFFVDPMKDYTLANNVFNTFTIDFKEEKATPRYEMLPLKLKLASDVTWTSDYANSGAPNYVTYWNNYERGWKYITLAIASYQNLSDFQKPTKYRNLVENFAKWMGSVSVQPPIDVSVYTTQDTRVEWVLDQTLPAGTAENRGWSTESAFNGVDAFIRSQIVYLSCTGLIPGRKHYVFFDGVPINSMCRQVILNQSYAVPSRGSTSPVLTGYGTALQSMNDGTMVVEFAVPPNTFLSGEKEVVVMDVNDLDSENAAMSIAKSTFRGFSSSQTVTTVMEVHFNVQRIDPLAQTFYVPNITGVGGVYLKDIGVLFARKPDSSDANTTYDWAGVTLEVRKVINGYPGGPKDVIFSTRLGVSDINVLSTSATTWTPGSNLTYFAMKEPLYVETDTEYAVVLYPDGNSPDYLAWVGKVGQTPVGASTPYNTQDITTVGTLFYSTNASAWTAVQDEDLCYVIRRWNWSTTQGSVQLVPNSYEFLTYTPIGNNRFDYVAGRPVAHLSNVYANGIPLITGTALNSGFVSSNTAPTQYYYQVKASNHTNLGTAALNSEFSGGAGIAILRCENTYCTAVPSSNNRFNIAAGNTEVTSYNPTNADFNTLFSPGMFVVVTATNDSNSFTDSTIRQVVKVSNSTHLVLDAPISTNALSNVNVFIANTVKVIAASVNAVPFANTININDLIPVEFANGHANATHVIMRAVTGTVFNVKPIENKIYLEGSTANSTVKINAAVGNTYNSMLVGTSFTNTTSFSTNITKISSIDNMVIDRFDASIRYRNPPGTSVVFTAQSNYNSANVSVQSKYLEPGVPIDFEFDAVLRSKSNEYMSNSSVVVNATLNTTRTETTPVVVYEPSAIVVYSAQINNDTAGENTDYGNALAKYVSRTITLGADAAEDLFTYVTAFRPANSDITLYARILSSGDVETLDDKDWSELVMDQGEDEFSSAANASDVREFRYTFKSRPDTTVTTGAGSYTNGTTTITGSNTLWNTVGSSQLVAGDVILVGSAAVDGAYDIATVNSVASDTSITIKSTLPFYSTGTYTGLTIEKLINPKEAFKCYSNENIVRYFDGTGAYHDGYQYFAIKAVMTRNQNIAVPSISDCRAIATSV